MHDDVARTKSVVVTGRVLELRCAEPEGLTALLAAEAERHVIATWGEHSRLVPEYRFHGPPAWDVITRAVEDWIARDNPWSWPPDAW